MNSLDQFTNLVERDKHTRKKIAVVGDSMQDVWIHGRSVSSQEGCPKFVEEERIYAPGGVANAARSLENWNAETFLIAPWDKDRCGKIDVSLIHPPRGMPVKKRFVNGFHRTEFRHDIEPHAYGLSKPELLEIRNLSVKAVRNCEFDAVLISDYAKGFVDEAMIRQLCIVCRDKGIPCVVDPKRSPKCCESAILKCNDEFLFKHLDACTWHTPALVLTLGADYPLIFNHTTHDHLCEVDTINLHSRHEPCVNHVGAGDCFAAHLTLALAHGIELVPAALIAHAAGQVYVRHPHGRPPWPHEIRKQLDPVGGKLLWDDAAALRLSELGRIVFTNGVFRLPHAGHAWLLREAKRLGDMLVVGINDDNSAKALGRCPCRPLTERVEVLAGLECVDWIIPFAEPDPCGIITALKPDILVKYTEYEGQRVPGDDIVKDVRFIGPSPYPAHCSDILTGGATEQP